MKRKMEHRNVQKQALVLYLFSLLFSCLLFMQSKTVFNNNQLEKLMFHFPQSVFADRTQVCSTINLYNLEKFKAIQAELFEICKRDQTALIFQFMEEKKQSDGRQEYAYYVFSPVKDALIETIKEPVSEAWQTLDALGALALLPDKQYPLSVPVLDESTRGQYSQEIQYSFHGMGELETQVKKLSPSDGAIIWAYPQAQFAPKIFDLLSRLSMPDETKVIPPEERKLSTKMTSAFAPVLALVMLVLMLILMISAAIQKEIYSLSVHLLQGQRPLRLMLKMFAPKLALSWLCVLFAQFSLVALFIRSPSRLARQFYLLLLKYDLFLGLLFGLLLLTGTIFLSNLAIISALKHRFSSNLFLFLGQVCKFLCTLLACCYCLGNWGQIIEHFTVLRELQHRPAHPNYLSLISQYEIMKQELPSILLPIREKFLLLCHTQEAFYFDSSQILSEDVLNLIFETDEEREVYEKNKILIVNLEYLNQGRFHLSLNAEQKTLFSEQKKPLLLRPAHTPIPQSYEHFSVVEIPESTEIYGPRLEPFRGNCLLLLPEGGDYPYSLSKFYLPDTPSNRVELNHLLDKANALAAEDSNKPFLGVSGQAAQFFDIQTVAGLDVPSVHKLLINELVLTVFYFLLWTLLLVIVVWHNAQSYFSARAKQIGILHLQGRRWWKIYRSLLEGSFFAYPLLYFLLRYWTFLRIQLIKLSLSYMFDPNDLRPRDLFLFLMLVALMEGGLFFYHMRNLERQSIDYVKGMTA